MTMGIEKREIKGNSSSLIEFYGIEEDVLRIWFRNGQVYDYFFVPEKVLKEFKKMCEMVDDKEEGVISEGSSSIGKWFSKNIKGVYVFQKVRDRKLLTIKK